MQASDFNAALHEHLRYLQRMRLAVEQRAAYAAAEQRRSTEGASISDHSDVQYPKTDFALKPGETITLKMGKVSSLSGKMARQRIVNVQAWATGSCQSTEPVNLRELCGMLTHPDHAHSWHACCTNRLAITGIPAQATVWRHWMTSAAAQDRSGPASRGVKLAGTVSALSPMSPVPGLAIPQLQPPGSNSQIPVLSPPPAKLASRSSAGVLATVLTWGLSHVQSIHKSSL